jgi:hypothetical protein
MKSIPSLLTGVAGEHYVAAELSRRGHIASITLRNTRGIDILASNESATRQVGIQVKASQLNSPSWLLNQKAEEFVADNLFYVFVVLKQEYQRPDFHIVPSKLVAQQISRGHRKWLATPGRKGQKHRDNPMRVFRDESGKFLEKWELLKL